MTFPDLCRELGRNTLSTRALQLRLALVSFQGNQYTTAYLEFLRTVVYLRMLGVSLEKIEDLWNAEKRLLTMLHADSSGSPTWYLDACGQKSNPERRLFLSNFDLGVPIPSGYVQLELDFAQRLSELFSPDEMGEDVMRQFRQYLDLLEHVRTKLRKELPMIRAAAKWASQIV